MARVYPCMRCLFIVQGEGRGHLTQAISLTQLLQAAGHTVIGAWVNVAKGRPIPEFFTDQFKAPITAINGPLMVYDPKTNALNVSATVRGVLTHLRRYRRSIRQLRDAIRDENPDVVINFFELLGGLTYGLYRPDVPMVCIGHQCMTFHPGFPFPPGKRLDKFLFKALIRLNTWGATELFGLSFDEQNDVPNQHLRVMPPLLRHELTERERVDDEPFILAYTTQPGLVKEVLATHEQCPDVMLHYFNSDTHEAEHRESDTLFYHQIDGKCYLDFMQRCRAVMTTAGFESVCEAMYLGKPVMMMPQPNHYEQMGNALDGQRVGAGIATDHFDLKKLLDYALDYDSAVSDRFRAWYATGQTRYITALEAIVQRK